MKKKSFDALLQIKYIATCCLATSHRPYVHIGSFLKDWRCPGRLRASTDVDRDTLARLMGKCAVARGKVSLDLLRTFGGVSLSICNR